MLKNSAMEKYFFDIPIYRCSIEKHEQELDDDKNKILQNLVDIHGPNVIHSESYKWIGNHFDRTQWYPWRYNEVIGWVRLYRCGGQVRGESWFTNANKIRRNLKHKRIIYKGKTFEIFLHENMSSKEIFESICSELEHQRTILPIKGRYMDMSIFLSIGRFINGENCLNLIGLTEIRDIKTCMFFVKENKNRYR